ncbi:MAG TPA: hypothetical protein VGC42_12715 [Kofleriaceae bacterium]
MYRTRAVLALAVLGTLAGGVSAQPVDPYAAPAPADPYAPAPGPTGADPSGMPDRIAAALIVRADELYEQRAFLDAKQLAVEALVQSPHGPASGRARAIIHAVNVELGIPEDLPRPPKSPKPPKPVDEAPPEPSKEPASPAEAGLPSGKLASAVHGGLYAGLLGAMIGSLFSDHSPQSGAIPMGIALGGAAAAASPWIVDRLGWTEAQVRTVGSATVWGGAVGGLLADLAKTEGTSAREVLVGAGIGATVVGAAGYGLMRSAELTRGDIALVDTFAGIGAVGGLTLGMLMQPAQGEAYSLNAMLGIAGGVAIGLIAAPQTNTTPRRMLRVAGLAAAGGGAPFLLYAAIHDRSSTADERITGLLSSAGLLVGAYLGFRWTDGMDDGLDTLDGKRHKDPDDAPLALVGRSSAGRWGIGGLGLAPLSPRLSTQPGLAFQLVGAAW